MDDESACVDVSAWDAGAQLGCNASDAAQGVLENLFNMLVVGSTWAVSWTGEAWLTFPEPTIGTADGTPAENIAQLWSLGSFYIVGIAVLGFLLAVIRLLMNPSMQSGAALARGIVAIIAVQALSVGATVLLLDAGNQYSVWVVEEASGKPFEIAFADFAGLGGVTSTLSAAGAVSQTGNILLFAVLGFVLLLLAAAAQVALLIIRSALLVILMAFLPFLAAAAFTDGGYKALGKGIGWIVALILYKPVAGTIYAVGTLTLTNAADAAEPTEQMMNLLIGVVIVAAAAIALPALIKFVAPQAAAGASMAFSGGAVAAGAIGTGAAVVAMGATAGAAAPAAAGAAGGAGTGAAGGAGAGAGSTTTATAGEGAAQTASTASEGGKPSGSPSSTPGNGGPGGSGSEGAGGGESSPSSTGTEPGNDGGSGSETGDDGSPASRSGNAGGTSGVAGGSTSSGPLSDRGPADPGDGSGGERADAPATGSQAADGEGSSGSGESSRSSGTETGPPGAEPATGSQAADGEGSSGSGESSRSSGTETGPAGAEPASAPAPVASGSGAPTSGRSGDAARAVRDVANGTRSGAEQVDFNEGQEQS